MKFLRICVLVIGVQVAAWGQIERPLTLVQADSLFLKHNLLLLAQQFNLDAQEALTQQARAYPNPIVSFDVNAWDPQNREVLHVGNTGQKSVAIEQLILLGGKRRTQIELARQNQKLATLELANLLRNLRFQLHNSFYALHQQNNVLSKYDRQLSLLDTLIASYDLQARKGNLPLKDVIRLKSVYLKINNDRSALAQERYDTQQRLQLLLQMKQQGITPIVPAESFIHFDLDFPLETLLAEARDKRPDLQLSTEQQQWSALNLKLQRQLGIPDVAVNASYDQRGGAFTNQINAGINMPLPLWNRNRGNIRAASYGLQNATTMAQQKQLEVESDVFNAWQQLNFSQLQYRKVKTYYDEDFDTVFRGVNENFQKRNMSILEFVDFFESYNESLAEYERVRYQLASAVIQVNYVTASNMYQP